MCLHMSRRVREARDIQTDQYFSFTIFATVGRLLSLSYIQDWSGDGYHRGGNCFLWFRDTSMGIDSLFEKGWRMDI